MSDYQLEIKQVVDYPRCRIYRQFIQNLMSDRNIRTGGDSGLFYYTVLCSYANFRTSYLRIDGIGYTAYPGEWICTVKALSAWFRTRFQCQAVSIMEELQKRHLVSCLLLGRGKVVYLRNGTGSPLVAYSEMAARWGVSKATAGRVLKKLADRDYISLMSFPGRTGSGAF